MDPFSMEGILHQTEQTGSSGTLQNFALTQQMPTALEGSLRARPLAQPLSIEEQIALSKKVTDIFDLGDWQNEQDVEMDDDAEETVIDVDDQEKRTESLKIVLPTIAQMWWAGSEQMDVVTEKLADASRDPKWRKPLGDSGILDFYLELFTTHELLRHTLKIHLLRLIGNSCADTDENRARVVASNHLPLIILQLQDTTVLAFAIPVLFNICVDYEPAQQQASNSYLTAEIIALISSPRLNECQAFLGYLCKILDLMIAQPSEKDLAPEITANVLLKLSADRESPVDMEDYMSLVNTAVAYLQHERFQRALITQGNLRESVITPMVDSYTRFDSQPSIGVSETDQDDAKALTQMRSNFNQVMSDVSALPEFRAAYPVTSMFTGALRKRLSSPQLQLQVLACIMLGNLARSDEACIEFVNVSRIHIPLITILSETHDQQLLHATLGFLKNLALPLPNKEIIGAAGIFEVLPRLWGLDALQQIQFSSISLARQLTIGTWENVRNVCQRLTRDEHSPANFRTNLSLLVSLFDRTDVEPIKMEISRLITSVCRVCTVYTGRPPEEMERIRIKFFKMHPDIGKPLSFMVSQTKWPVVRSEGWFVFALMARFPEGAQCISDLLHDVVVFRPLVEMLTGKDLVDATAGSSTSSPSSTSKTNTLSPTTASTSASSPPPLNTPGLDFSPTTPEPHAQAAEMARIDRENALVLITELLKNRGSEMALMRRTLFEDLLKGGGELVMSYREAKPSTGDKPVQAEKRPSAGMNMQEITQQTFAEFQ